MHIQINCEQNLQNWDVGWHDKWSTASSPYGSTILSKHLHLLPELVSVGMIYPWRSQGSLTSLQLVLATQWQPHLQLCHGNVWLEQKVIWPHVLIYNSKQVVCTQHSISIKHIIQLSWRATKADLNLNVGKKKYPQKGTSILPRKCLIFRGILNFSEPGIISSRQPHSRDLRQYPKKSGHLGDVCLKR